MSQQRNQAALPHPGRTGDHEDLRRRWTRHRTDQPTRHSGSQRNPSLSFARSHFLPNTAPNPDLDQPGPCLDAAGADFRHQPRKPDPPQRPVRFGRLVGRFSGPGTGYPTHPGGTGQVTGEFRWPAAACRLQGWVFGLVFGRYSRFVTSVGANLRHPSRIMSGERARSELGAVFGGKPDLGRALLAAGSVLLPARV